MTENDIILEARKFVHRAEIKSVPVNIDTYLNLIGAKCRFECDLPPDSDGSIITVGDKRVILVNDSHSLERKRFTILHEIAHVVLGIESPREGASKLGFAKSGRAIEEIYCDLFAAECLLPKTFFEQDVKKFSPSLSEITELAKNYQSSLACTCSRYVEHSDEACAYVLSRRGKVLYSRCSKELRSQGGYIRIGLMLSQESVAHELINGVVNVGSVAKRVPNHVWFDNDKLIEGDLCEETVYLKDWEQSITLLSDIEVREKVLGSWMGTEKEALEELDGVLPWPSKSRRRK